MFRTQTRGFALARPTARRFRSSSFSFETDPALVRESRPAAWEAAPSPQPDACLDVLLARIDDGDHPLITPLPSI